MSVKKTGNINISQVLTELPISARNASGRTLTTSTTASHDDSMEFEVDLSDLETFGDITPSNVKKTESDRDSAAVKRKKTVSQTNECSQNESVACLDDNIDNKNSESLKNSDHLPSTVDSDDDKLIIADASPNVTEKQGESPSPELCSQSKARGAKQRRKSPASADQLGEILQMQTAMFTSKTADRASKGSKNSPSSRPEPPQPQQTSLVKACVSSYLERNPNQEEETGDVVQNVAAPESAGCKKRLTLDLQELTEDERDYEGPEEGNVLYKLFSLDELLLMVRTSIDFTHTRKLENENKCVPVKVFPKLEYQLTYGVECLSNSEACQLWTETLLHSSTDLFIAHIDAFTSKVALVRQLQDDWIYNVHTVFKPAKSLNILHHILQKLTGLDEGRYLLRHKVGEPFVNILKAAPGNGRQGVHNLQQIHSDVPPPPSSAVPPWIPLDPTVVLPVHRQHGRVPCTFPPKDYTPPQQWRTLQSQRNKGGQPGKKKPKRKPKKKNQPRQ